MTYNAEQITFMLAEAIDQDREYKSWHVSTRHLMALVERVVTEEREACAALCFEMWEKWMDADPSKRDNLPRDAEDCAAAIRARGQA
jgi:hypothetical protein